MTQKQETIAKIDEAIDALESDFDEIISILIELRTKIGEGFKDHE